MVNPENAQKILSEHFKQTTLDEFKERHERYVGVDQTELAVSESASPTSQIVLYRCEAAPLRLEAYLASALTGLNQEQRNRVFEISDLVVSICHKLEINVYEPRKVSDPIKYADLSAEAVFATDRERVLSSDLLIHVCDYPSTGSGEELDFAFGALLPIVLISHSKYRVSRMVTGIPTLKIEIEYTDPEELRLELRERLIEIRPILEERKMVFSNFNKNIVGNKIRLLRQELDLTREDVASSSKGLLTVEELQVLEDNTDKVSNPSLMQLRTLATILKTTVADLVEPDLNERVLLLLQEWLEGKNVARYGISQKDMNIITSRILLRIADSLLK